MSRYMARRWLLAAMGFSLSLVRTGVTAQETQQTATEVQKEVKGEAKKAEAKNAEQKKAAEPTEAEAKLRKELDAKSAQLKTMQEKLNTLQEQLRPLREMQQYQDD